MVNNISATALPNAGFALGLTPFASESHGHYLVHFAQVHRGDVVVLLSIAPDQILHQARVVGIGGDTVQVKNGAVFLNGAPMPDPHAHFNCLGMLAHSPRDNYGPTTVPAAVLYDG